MNQPITTLCPRCGNDVTWDASSPYRPFCSERCHLIDLGAWLSQEHGIPGEETGAGPENGESGTENQP